MSANIGRLARCEQRQEQEAMVKPPLSVRQNPERLPEFHALHESVPVGLRPSLLDWTVNHYARSPTFTNETRLGRLERVVNRELIPAGYRSLRSEFKSVLGTDDDLLLDAADVALTWASKQAIAELSQYFIEARSTYGIGLDEDGDFEIQRRQPEEMSKLIETEANQPGRAAEHLRAAWSKCFGLHPDLNEASIEAVKAIEVAAKHVVTPNDAAATLGKMCSALRDKPSKWETLSESGRGVETVLSMMEMVWEGHLRHGDESAPLEVSQEAAEMTVQTAVLLVSWFRSSRIRLKP